MMKKKKKEEERGGEEEEEQDTPNDEYVGASSMIYTMNVIITDDI